MLHSLVPLQPLQPISFNTLAHHSLVHSQSIHDTGNFLHIAHDLSALLGNLLGNLVKRHDLEDHQDVGGSQASLMSSKLAIFKTKPMGMPSHLSPATIAAARDGTRAISPSITVRLLLRVVLASGTAVTASVLDAAYGGRGSTAWVHDPLRGGVGACRLLSLEVGWTGGLVGRHEPGAHELELKAGQRLSGDGNAVGVVSHLEAILGVRGLCDGK